MKTNKVGAIFYFHYHPRGWDQKGLILCHCHLSLLSLSWEWIITALLCQRWLCSHYRLLILGTKMVIRMECRVKTELTFMTVGNWWWKWKMAEKINPLFCVCGKNYPPNNIVHQRYPSLRQWQSNEKVSNEPLLEQMRDSGHPSCLELWKYIS